MMIGSHILFLLYNIFNYIEIVWIVQTVILAILGKPPIDIHPESVSIIATCRTAWVLQTRTTRYWRFMWSLKTACPLLKSCSYFCPFNSRSAILELGWPSIYHTYYLKFYGLIQQPIKHRLIFYLEFRFFRFYLSLTYLSYDILSSSLHIFNLNSSMSKMI